MGTNFVVLSFSQLSNGMLYREVRSMERNFTVSTRMYIVWRVNADVSWLHLVLESYDVVSPSLYLFAVSSLSN